LGAGGYIAGQIGPATAWSCGAVRSARIASVCHSNCGVPTADRSPTRCLPVLSGRRPRRKSRTRSGRRASGQGVIRGTWQRRLPARRGSKWAAPACGTCADRCVDGYTSAAWHPSTRRPSWTPASMPVRRGSWQVWLAERPVAFWCAASESDAWRSVAWVAQVPRGWADAWPRQRRPPSDAMGWQDARSIASCWLHGSPEPRSSPVSSRDLAAQPACSPTGWIVRPATPVHTPCSGPSVPWP